MGLSVIEFFRRTIIPSKFVQLFVRTFIKWQQDNCLDMGAALAYYALFSLFPVILVILSIFGFVSGPSTQIYEQILAIAREGLPPDAFAVVEEVLLKLNRDSVSAGIAGFLLLMISASGFFSALDRAFDIIWRVNVEWAGNTNLNRMARNFVRKRIVSFLLVFGAAALMLVSLVATIAIRVLLKLIETVNSRITFIQIDSVLTLRVLQMGSSVLLLTLVMVILYKMLPTTRVAWGDVLLGGVITSALLLLLQHLVSNSFISFGARFQSYGVIGGVMVLMLWIYLTSQIFFWGGEFTYVFSHIFGSRRPSRR